MNSIGISGLDNGRDSVSLWRVALPPDIDRESYIQSCYLSGTITVANDNGELIHNVRIGKVLIQLVDFPETLEDTGSDVLCMTAPYTGQLFIVEVYSTGKQSAYQKENQFRFLKNDGIGTAGVLIDGRGNIILSVDGEEEDGTILITVSNKERKGKLTINVNGEINVINDGTTNIKSTEQVFIDSPKILLNDSEEPVILGKKLVDLLSEWLDQLGKESAGPYPLLGNQFYIQLKEKLEALKSTLSFVK